MELYIISTAVLAGVMLSFRSHIKATGERIRQLRIEHHLKVEEIAEYMGFGTDQAIYKWQRGESLPTVENLYALSILFNTSIEDILCEYKENTEIAYTTG